MINRGVRLNNRYVIDRVVGEGGGGVVYRAFDSNLQNYVVVKQIKESAASLLESRAEADILKGLKHENLPKVLDFFEDHGRVFTVIDFIEGISLSEALKRRGWFGQKEVLNWARQLSRALEYLHSQRIPIIHSDIKTGNIMWNERTGAVCLIDFNISLAFHKGQKSVTWLSGGYSPPEQYRNMEQYCAYLERVLAGPTRHSQAPGRPGQMWGSQEIGSTTKIFSRQAFANLEPMINSKVDERSDIYSFGATLYHLLTGRKPHINFLNIVPISAYSIPLSEGLSHIIETCMELSPEKRYQNGMQLNLAFEHIYELDSEYRRFWKKRFWGNVASSAMIAGGIFLTGAGVLVKGREGQIQYQAYVQEAEQLLEDGEAKKASELIEKAQKLVKNRVDADALELLLLYQKGEYDACVRQGLIMLGEKQYQIKGEADRKKLGSLYYIMGNAFLEQERNKEAADYLEKALEYQEENPDLFRDYAIALARCGRIGPAKQALEQASGLDLDSDSIAFASGEISYAQKDYLSAQKELSDMIERTQEKQLKERAILLLNQMYVQCGPEYLNTAIYMLEEETKKQENASNKKLLEALAGDYLLRGEQSRSVEDRIRALNQYIAIYNMGDKTLRVMGNIGILYRETGNIQEAQKMAELLLDQYPNDYQGHKLLAFLELDKQQKKENSQRNYENFRICYENARTLYEKQEQQQDEEMELLEQMYEDLLTGGWYERQR